MSEKLRYDLIHPIILEELAHVFTVGARKYSPNGWLTHPIPIHEEVAALYRHLQSRLRGEHMALDDGQSHLASVMWRAGTLRVYDRLGLTHGELPYETGQTAAKGLRRGSDKYTGPERRHTRV